jgi:hypothetical protein
VPASPNLAQRYAGAPVKETELAKAGDRVAIAIAQRRWWLRLRARFGPDPGLILMALFRSPRSLTPTEISKLLVDEGHRISPRHVEGALTRLRTDPSTSTPVAYEAGRYSLTPDGRALLQLPARELAARLGREH